MTSAERDHLIREDVEEELAWAPQVTDANVGVSVVDGVVTLYGEVGTSDERVEAMRAALRVSGVSVVANELSIRGREHLERTDSDIAAAVKHVLDWSADLPADGLQVEVHDHVVVLTGAVEWNYQRASIERLVRSLAGVGHLDNRITLTKRASAADTSRLIKNALVRHALLDAEAISVVAVGSEVTLSGVVSTSAERDAAARAAWSSPHTSAVHDKIVVRR
ncbi:MAG: BON domain-containing protein [Aeromicrobium sp.]